MPGCQAKFHVVLNIEPGQECKALEHHGQVWIGAHQGCTFELNATIAWSDQARHDPKQGAFAAAAAAQEGHHFTSTDREADAL